MADDRFRGHLDGRPLGYAAGAIVMVAVAAGLYWLRVYRSDLDITTLTPDDVVRFARAWAPWSVLAAIGLMVIHSFLPFPSEVVAVASGMMFGSAIGVLVTWAGAMLGAVLSFALARVFGRPAMRYLVPVRYSDAMEAWEPRVTTLLVVRLIPVISFNLINYGAGLARVAWWPFLWTTGLGILPLTVISVGFGSHLLELGWRTALAIAVGVAVLWILARPLARRFHAAMIEGSKPADHARPDDRLG